jgi:hypothetical protein
MIANGHDWFNKESKQGNVLVMAGEGLSGLSRRLRAIEKEHDLSIVQDKLHISSRAIGLDTENGYKQVEQAISELDAPPKLIFIDTLSRHLMDSEENSNDDMARFINKLEDIRLKYGCTIVLVHHTGKGGNQTARGASALKANIDFSFFVDGENKSCSFSCDKMKDADDAIPTKYFEIKAVDLGIVTSKDKPITGACIVDSTKPISIKVNKQNKDELAYSCFNSDKKLWQQAYLDACTDAISAESKAKQYREGRKALIVAGKVIENQDGSFSVNDGV